MFLLHTLFTGKSRGKHKSLGKDRIVLTVL